MSRPLISIVICSYNRSKLLPQTLATVLEQTYQPVEIVFLDDGSTDDTAQLIASYGDKIRYYRQDNQGIAISRTNACKVAKGEYIAFLDDDDLMPPDRISVLYQSLRDFPSAVLAVGNFSVISVDDMLEDVRELFFDANEKKKVPCLIEDGYAAILWPRVPAAPHTTLFKKVDGDKIGWFDHHFRYGGEDKDFFSRLAKLGPIVHVPQTISLYRRGHDSITANNSSLEFAKIMLFEKHIKLLSASDGKLYRRLQQRILKSLLDISCHRALGEPLPVFIPEDYEQETLLLLNPKYKIKYLYNRLIKLPILEKLMKL